MKYFFNMSNPTHVRTCQRKDKHKQERLTMFTTTPTTITTVRTRRTTIIIRSWITTTTYMSRPQIHTHHTKIYTYIHTEKREKREHE